MLISLKNSMLGYTVRGLKTMQGRDGVAYNATIFKNGVKIADVRDDGNGGAIDIRYVGVSASLQFQADAEVLYPTAYESEGSLVAFLCDTHESIKKIERAVKKATLFTVLGDPADTYRIIKVPFDAAVAKTLRTKFGVLLGVIINEQVG